MMKLRIETGGEAQRQLLRFGRKRMSAFRVDNRLSSWWRRSRCAVHIELPRQAKEVMWLLRLVISQRTASPGKINDIAKSSMFFIHYKLQRALGFSWPLADAEKPFFDTIMERSLRNDTPADDYGVWLVYADWLEEHGEHVRAQLIRDWVSPTTKVPVYHGVPDILRAVGK